VRLITHAGEGTVDGGSQEEISPQVDHVISLMITREGCRVIGGNPNKKTHDEYNCDVRETKWMGVYNAGAEGCQGRTEMTTI
jgi:hypothetical protein